MSRARAEPTQWIPIGRALPVAWLALAGLLGLTGAAHATEVRRPEPRGEKAEGPDAEMLRDLELLQSADYAREREVGRRLRVLERLRFLEQLRYMESQPPAAPGQPASPAAKEVK